MSPKRVLVVDDDYDLNGSLKEFLESEGFSVSSAFDGNEARELLLRWDAEGLPAPQFMLLDLMMPKMSGQELLSHLQPTALLNETRVVILSAASDPKEIPVDIPVTFLAKPFDLTELLGVLT